jgi:hypothetical protein
MKAYLFLLYMLCFLTFVSCDKLKFGLEATDITIVTGLNTWDEYGTRLQQLGNPNEKSFNVSIVFPNPAYHQINVTAHQNRIEKLWIVPGEPVNRFQKTDFADLLAKHQYPEADIAANSVEEISVESHDYTIDFSLNGPGCYRIFVLLDDGSLDWKNVYILNPNDSKGWDKIMKKWK